MWRSQSALLFSADSVFLIEKIPLRSEKDPFFLYLRVKIRVLYENWADRDCMWPPLISQTVLVFNASVVNWLLSSRQSPTVESVADPLLAMFGLYGCWDTAARMWCELDWEAAAPNRGGMKKKVLEDTIKFIKQFFSTAVGFYDCLRSVVEINHHSVTVVLGVVLLKWRINVVFLLLFVQVNQLNLIGLVKQCMLESHGCSSLSLYTSGAVRVLARLWECI